MYNSKLKLGLYKVEFHKLYKIKAVSIQTGVSLFSNIQRRKSKLNEMNSSVEPNGPNSKKLCLIFLADLALLGFKKTFERGKNG